MCDYLQQRRSGDKAREVHVPADASASGLLKFAEGGVDATDAGGLAGQRRVRGYTQKRAHNSQ